MSQYFAPYFTFVAKAPGDGFYSEYYWTTVHECSQGLLTMALEGYRGELRIASSACMCMREELRVDNDLTQKGVRADFFRSAIRLYKDACQCGCTWEEYDV